LEWGFSRAVGGLTIGTLCKERLGCCRLVPGGTNVKWSVSSRILSMQVGTVQSQHFNMTIQAEFCRMVKLGPLVAI
jgi:hypothetical protein